MNESNTASAASTARPADFARVSLADYGDGLRRRAFGARATVTRLLDAIERENATLDAFTYVDAEGALEAARAVDALLAARTDLGPLMGVPIALKDLYAVSGMPLTAGSRVDVRDCTPEEGTIVRTLKRSGAIVLGKTRTTEFAFGTFNPSHPTPRNPRDANVHRMPGGSSSGSAVAQAASLCAIAFGSDTGGSVRQPAALCGVAGFKPTAGRLPLDGVFPLSPTFDSPGWFAHRVDDVALVWHALSGEAPKRPRPIDTLVLGRPVAHFFDDLDDDVAAAIDDAERALRAAGARIVPVTLPPVDDLDAAFGGYLGAELVAHLGRARVEANLERMDAIAAARITPGLSLRAETFLDLQHRFARLAQQAQTAIAGVDALLCPTCPRIAPPIEPYRTADKAGAWSRNALRLTRPGNLFRYCGISLPIGRSALPVGLQLLGRAGGDTELLAVAGVVDAIVGRAEADI
ncbi:MAG TPA: amidase [Casimicrobiaceae bacterium]|nr:amidase [Casimicrobiaceae bacterium]